MGYCYDARSGALVCDNCGNTGHVRKRHCPFGYCPSPAICPKCWANPIVKDAMRPDAHKDCAIASAEMKLREYRERELLAEGKLVRWSAIMTDTPGHTKVTFRNDDYSETAEYIVSDYDNHNLGKPTTPDDYTIVERVS